MRIVMLMPLKYDSERKAIITETELEEITNIIFSTKLLLH